MIIRRKKTKELRQQIDSIMLYDAPAEVVDQIKSYGRAVLARKIGVTKALMSNALNNRAVLSEKRYQQILKIINGN